MDDKNSLSYFFLGLGLGVAVGLLFAPKAGADTRDMISSKADEGKEYLKSRSEDLRASASDILDKGRASATDILDKGRDLVSKQKDQLDAAVQAGKQAYRDTVGAAGQAAAQATNS